MGAFPGIILDKKIKKPYIQGEIFFFDELVASLFWIVRMNKFKQGGSVERN